MTSLLLTAVLAIVALTIAVIPAAVILWRARNDDKAVDRAEGTTSPTVAGQESLAA